MLCQTCFSVCRGDSSNPDQALGRTVCFMGIVFTFVAAWYKQTPSGRCFGLCACLGLVRLAWVSVVPSARTQQSPEVVDGSGEVVRVCARLHAAVALLGSCYCSTPQTRSLVENGAAVEASLSPTPPLNPQFYKATSRPSGKAAAHGVIAVVLCRAVTISQSVVKND